MKHNPAFLSREELVRSFVARQEDLAFVLDHIADNTGPSSQHLLVVAPRGMGKTTLVLRAADAVRTEPRFSEEWYPLVYAEETYEVMSAGELWLEGLRHLADQTNDPEMLAVHKDLRREPDEQRLYDRALGRLLEFADQHKKRILLVIENLHMLLDEQISKADAWKLRKTLQHERRLMLLATATSSFEAIDNAEQAFFDQFRIYRLEPLDLESARRVWSYVAGVPASAEHMRPLQILTGGNPRLLAILASFAGGMSLRALMGDLVRLVDDHTTYFKSNVDSLPAKERKVYITLAELWQPSTAREVAEVARMTPSEVSALLNRLTQRGAVTTSGEERKRVYQLAERMYNIYYLMRRSGGDESRVRAVVDFMVAFYDPVSMSRVIRAIAEEGSGLGDLDRRDHLLVMESLFRRESNPRVREFWWKEAGEHIEKMPDAPRGLLEDAEKIRITRTIAKLIDMGLPMKELLQLIGESESVAVEMAQIPPGNAVNLQELAARGEVSAAHAGVYTTLTGGCRAAIPMLQLALQGNHSTSRRGLLLACLARCQFITGHLEDAEKLICEATSLLPNAPELAAFHALVLLGQKGKALEAESQALRAIHLEPKSRLGWDVLLESLDMMSQDELASSRCAAETGPFEEATAVENRAAHAIWSLVFGTKAGDRIHTDSGLQSLQKLWNERFRVRRFGLILLEKDVKLGELEEATLLVNQLSSSLVELDILDVFNVLWDSGERAVHTIAKSHLPILLADATLAEARLPLLGLLILLGDWKQASEQLPALLALDFREDEGTERPSDLALDLWTRLFIDAAATGKAREALDLLTPSPLARWLEPVVVALQSYIGQPHRAPLEIVEVARDVTDRIRARAKALEEGAKEGAPARPARPKKSPEKAAKPAKQTARAAHPKAKSRSKIK
ncbi:MAG: AAA family ATPase [Polyangiaceae bacterium]